MATKNVNNDFKTEYRKVQQVGNTQVQLLCEFENDAEFMKAFEAQFEAAPKLPDVSKYWRKHYTESEITKLIRSNKAAPLYDLRNEFNTLISEDNVPKDCFTNDIKQTNIYAQFKAIEDIFNSFKEMKDFEFTENRLVPRAEQFGLGIISEVEKIDYKPIREKVISTIINDKGNININLPEILDNRIKNDDFAAKYLKAKMCLDNFLSRYLKQQESGTAKPQQTETKRERETQGAVNEYLKSLKEAFNNDADYHQANTFIENFFSGTQLNIIQPVFVKNGNIKNLAFALGEIWRSKRNDVITYEYLEFYKQAFSIFQNHSIDKNNLFGCNLYKYSISRT